MAPFDRPYTTFCRSAIVRNTYSSILYIIFELFNTYSSVLYIFELFSVK